ncbi:carbohydrate ABC transporter permease [Bauldia sp.]|uniref:carbohydrate ABC transporter permease n=1 Tax=Bauldia sp. TaxID=2575872 RepID=UPI003BAD1B60
MARSRVSRWLNRRTGALMLVPGLCLVLALAVIPAISSLGISLEERALAGGAGSSWTGLTHYADWLRDPVFWNAVRLSLIWTIGAVALQLAAGLGVALLLSNSFPGRGLVRALILIPWILPIVTTANIWVWMFNEIYGVINSTLIASGLISRPIGFLSDPDLSIFSAIWVKAWREFPFAALLLMAGIQTIPKDLYEAAKLDGATAWQRFLHVTLPGLKLVLLIILLLQTIWTFNDVSTVYLLTRGGPGSSTEILPILVYNTSFIGGDLGKGAAGAVLMFAIVAVIVAVYFRQYARSETEVRG